MTTEEASVIIGIIPIEGDDCYTIAEYQEAKAMAIKALEQIEIWNATTKDRQIIAPKGTFQKIWEDEQQPCEDCISRKEVLEYLDKMPIELTSDGRIMVRRRTLEEYISDTLPSVTPQQARWIPCSERLPERDTDVLAYHKNESFEYVYVSWIDDYTGKWAGFIGNLSDDVLAWMPLPEPYKAESDKEGEE